MDSIRDAIKRLVDEEAIDESLAEAVATEILTGEATPSQIGAFLMGLRIRGEKPEHIRGFAKTMRAQATPIDVSNKADLVDTCGTGGDHSGTFNISTAAALVAAGAGVRVAKHGNRAITGKCGSADVLSELGVNIEATPEVISKCIEEAGVGFLFAPVFHGAMRHAGPTRKEIGVRTIFNVLGPLSNPAGAKRQVIGVYDKNLVKVFAEVLLGLGSTHVMIVHGSDGLDELTLTGPSTIAHAKNGEIEFVEVDPEALGLELASAEALTGGIAGENSQVILKVLEGEQGARRDITVLNAAAAIVVADKADSLEDGIALAQKSIDDGAASKCLQQLIATSNQEA